MFGNFQMNSNNEMASHLPFTLDGIDLLGGGNKPVSPPLLAPMANTDFAATLGSISPLLPDLAASVVASYSNYSASVAPHAAVVAGAASFHPLPPFAERSLSRSSYSPAMSDSGISVDAASNGSASSQLSLGALAKLGPFGMNNQGQSYNHIRSFVAFLKSFDLV